MREHHKDTINAVENCIRNSSQYKIIPKKFYDEKIRGDNKKGVWGYKPDVVMGRTDKTLEKLIIVEVENCWGNPSKVIEDIVLSASIKEVEMLIIITPYQRYIQSWFDLLSDNDMYPSIKRLNFKVIESKDEKDIEKVLYKMKELLGIK